MKPRSFSKPRTRRSRDHMRNMRQRVCRFCEENIHFIDYKDSETLSRFVTEKGKIIPRRITGTCANHQKVLRNAIVRARVLSLLR